MTADNTFDDSALLWSLACNCLLYEADPGPANINIGSPAERMMVSRQQAWRELYGRLLIERVDADATRIDAIERDCRAELADSHRPEHWQRIYEERRRSGDSTAGEVLTDKGQREIREVWECAIALCEQATQMIRESGAADDEQARQRFLAGIKHQNTVDVLGAIPGVTENSAEELTRRLKELDQP
ncbi:hypothetical protein [Couchioplanes azureus]|uniref:hypothetical protein n=1 Tax=Couchioplanes caeruleus TaxID=56438 RepID=UPI0016711D49|nr:hypothetical protein [Couchioplanes caeruleus]GGQ88223.1 hypothetical protein GCM10010166_67780 [Couchioplanes caeruleus subsp. azureus]